MAFQFPLCYRRYHCKYSKKTGNQDGKKILSDIHTLFVRIALMFIGMQFILYDLMENDSAQKGRRRHLAVFAVNELMGPDG